MTYKAQTMNRDVPNFYYTLLFKLSWCHFQISLLTKPTSSGVGLPPHFGVCIFFLLPTWLEIWLRSFFQWQECSPCWCASGECRIPEANRDSCQASLWQSFSCQSLNLQSLLESWVTHLTKKKIYRYILSTVHISIVLARLIQAFIVHVNDEGGAILYLADIGAPLNRAKDMVYVSVVRNRLVVVFLR